MLALLERDGFMRSQHVANVTSKTLCPVIEANIDRRSYLMTDEIAAEGVFDRPLKPFRRVGQKLDIPKPGRRFL